MKKRKINKTIKDYATLVNDFLLHLILKGYNLCHNLCFPVAGKV